MSTESVVLTPAQNVLVERLVESGRYESLSEVLKAGLRLLEEQESDLDGIGGQLVAEAAHARVRARVQREGRISLHEASGRAACLE